MCQKRVEIGQQSLHVLGHESTADNAQAKNHAEAERLSNEVNFGSSCIRNQTLDILDIKFKQEKSKGEVG